MGGAADEEALGRHFHRPQLHVGLHEVPLGGAGEFDERGQFLGVGRHHAGAQGQQVGIHLEVAADDRIVEPDRDPAFTLSFPPSHRRIVYETGHLDLLSRQEVYEQILAWLQP